MAGSQDLLRLRGHQDPTEYEGSGLLGGSILAPAWAVAVLGGAVALSGIFYFAWRIRRARHKARFTPGVRRG